MPDSTLVAVVGPTGSGKSALALSLATAFSGEIVNCDSLQIYRYLDIGTAKPTPSERSVVPHHLFDIIDPDQVFTAGEYARRARPLLAEIAARGRLPVVVGGTGFYLKALLEGLFPGPERDEDLRRRLAAREARRPGSLHRILRRLDPVRAAQIHSRDRNKLIRALEVSLQARRPMSALFAAGRQPLRGFRALKLGLDPPRQELFERLDRRTRAMFESGLLEEVKSILARGFPDTSKSFESHGYRQAVQLLRGELSPDEALYHAQRNTRRYAKRQWTWFRRDSSVAWLRGFGEAESVRQAAAERVGSQLADPSR